MNSVHLYQRKRRAERELKRNANFSAVTNNRLEALISLANSIMEEAASLKQNGEAVTQERLDLAEEVKRFEIGLIKSALARAGGNKREAARLLNVKPTTLYEKMKRCGMIQSEAERDGRLEAEEIEEPTKETE
jgi:DNA-binding NtrC family response regulator